MSETPTLICPKEPLFQTSAKQKLLSKEAAHRTRFGSPKLRDLLREKCRIRVKEARSDSFEITRQQSLISKIIREELNNIDNDINLQEEIYKELIADINEWLVEEHEVEENYLIEVGDIEVIFCPICQKSNLSFKNKIFDCPECSNSFTYERSKKDFQKEIELALNDHEDECDAALLFFVEPEAKTDLNHLNTICEKCEFFHNFV